MKSIKQRILGLINTLITGAVTGFVLATFISGMEEDSRCEYCSMMIYPAILFFLMLMPGVFTLFCHLKTLNKHKRMLNILNGIGILISLAAIIYNVMASSHGTNG